jgi:hypothetical protein
VSFLAQNSLKRFLIVISPVCIKSQVLAAAKAMHCAFVSVVNSAFTAIDKTSFVITANADTDA